MFIANINKYHNGDIKLVSELIKKSKELGFNYVKINKYNIKKIDNYNKQIETLLDDKILEEVYKENNFNEKEIKYLTEYAINLGIKLYAKVEDIESINLMSKYTDICEIDYKDLTYKMFEYCKKLYKKVIVRIKEPSIDDIENLYYTYNPNIIILDTENLYLIKNINKKIGNIIFGYRNKNELFYIPALMFGCKYFEKEFNIIIDKDLNKYKKLIDNIKFINKKIN